jgi:hypothetical protein
VQADVCVGVERVDAVDVGAVVAGVNYLPGGGLGAYRGADEIWRRTALQWSCEVSVCGGKEKRRTVA